MSTLAPPSHRPTVPPSARRGITLLEVLISMFVMLVGLLGVLSLIPVARLQQQRGAKIDRAAACGRAASREMHARGILNPTGWAKPDANATQFYDPAGYLAALATATSNGDPLPSGPFSYTGTPWAALPANAANNPRIWSSSPFPFVPVADSNFLVGVAIDPLGVAAGLGSTFPVGATVPAAMPRITSGPFGSGNATVRAALADTIFRWQDDLTFDTPTNTDRLPSQVQQGTNVRRLSQGDYSWFATVVPDPAMTNRDNSFDVPCIVSVADYKRVLNPGLSGERVCALDPAVTNMQDEVRLTLTAAAVAPQYGTDGNAHLNVKPGQWIMLAGWRGAPADPQWHFRWHRIAAVDEIQGGAAGPWSRNVTLVGPFPDLNTLGIPWANVTAFLFDGIVAVYEKNMKLELDSMY